MQLKDLKIAEVIEEDVPAVKIDLPRCYFNVHVMPMKIRKEGRYLAVYYSEKEHALVFCIRKNKKDHMSKMNGNRGSIGAQIKNLKLNLENKHYPLKSEIIKGLGKVWVLELPKTESV